MNIVHLSIPCIAAASWKSYCELVKLSCNVLLTDAMSMLLVEPPDATLAEKEQLLVVYVEYTNADFPMLTRLT